MLHRRPIRSHVQDIHPLAKVCQVLDMLLQGMLQAAFHWLESPYLFRQERMMGESERGSLSSQQRP